MKTIIFAFSKLAIKQNEPATPVERRWSSTRTVLAGLIAVMVVAAGWIGSPWDRVGLTIGCTLALLLMLRYQPSWSRLRIALPVAVLGLMLALIGLRDCLAAVPVVGIVVGLILSKGSTWAERGVTLAVGIVLGALLLPPADMTEHQLARARRRARERLAQLHPAPPALPKPVPQEPDH